MAVKLKRNRFITFNPKHQLQININQSIYSRNFKKVNIIEVADLMDQGIINLSLIFCLLIKKLNFFALKSLNYHLNRHIIK